MKKITDFLPLNENVEVKVNPNFGKAHDQDKYHVYVNGKFFSSHPTEKGARKLGQRKLEGKLNEVDEFADKIGRNARKQLGLKVTANPKTLQNFDPKTTKDKTRRADQQPGDSVEKYFDSNIDIKEPAFAREEVTRELIDMLNEISQERLKSYSSKAQDDKYDAERKKKSAMDRYHGAPKGSPSMKKARTDYYNQSIRADKRAYGLAKAKEKIKEEVEFYDDEILESVSPMAAHHILTKHGAHGKDFFNLSYSQIDALHHEAKKHGYRGSNNGASLARNFHHHLEKKAAHFTAEETEISEVSSDRLKSYLGKGEEDYHNRVLNKKNTYGSDFIKKTGNRARSLNKAEDKLKSRGIKTDWEGGKPKFTKEEVELDEGDLTHTFSTTKSGNGYAWKVTSYHAGTKETKVLHSGTEASRAKAMATAKKKLLPYRKASNNTAAFHNKNVKEETDVKKKLTENTLSAKAGREGKDLGKPGKNFSKIENKAAKEYGSKKAGERVAGAILAKMRKEEVELDELSKERIGDYMAKAKANRAASKDSAVKHIQASKEWSGRAAKANGAEKQYHQSIANDHKTIANKFIKRHNKRVIGLGLAKKKMAEEVELDEISDSKKSDYVNKAKNNIAQTKERLRNKLQNGTLTKQDHKDAKHNAKRIARVKKLTNEETDIQEISVDRKNEYMDKAITSVRQNAAKAIALKDTDRATALKHKAAVDRRKKGLDTLHRSVTKEETDIQEISLERKKEYVKNALVSANSMRKAGTDEKGRTSNRALIDKANKRGKIASNLDDKMKKDAHKAFMKRLKKK